MKLFYKACVLVQLFMAFIYNDRNKVAYMQYLFTSDWKERRNPSRADDRINKKHLEDHNSIVEVPNDKYSLFLER